MESTDVQPRAVRPEREVIGLVTGVLGAIGLACALVAVRGEIINANAALALVVPVLLGAVIGGRWAGAASAIAAALSFDFFFTRPYGSLTIENHNDVETTIILLVVALIAAEIGIRAQRVSSAAKASKSEVDRLYRIAELATRAHDPTDVILAVQAELMGLLDLDDCEYEAVPSRVLPALDHSGVITGGRLTWAHGEFALPEAGVELPVTARGVPFGRLVLRPHVGAGASLEQRRVAVALADELGLVLASARGTDTIG
jgi:K+-sensing histidine kinase KdpD